MRIVIALCCMLFGPWLVAAQPQVPFGDVVSEKVTNYHRHTPTLATSGKLQPGAAQELKAHGFVTVVDLRNAHEGLADGIDVANEKAALEAVEISYINLPMGKGWPTPEQVDQFGRIVENQAMGPVLLHCGSANRAAVLWSAYRLQMGVAFEQVLLEARTIGIKPARESQLREAVGLN